MDPLYHLHIYVDLYSHKHTLEVEMDFYFSLAAII